MRPTLRHIIINLSKNKDRMFKIARKNDLSHTRDPPKDYQQISHQKLWRPEATDQYVQSAERK